MIIKDELNILCELLNLTETQLANELGVTYETLNNWKVSKSHIEVSNLELIYSFAYVNNIKFNIIYEQLLREDYQKDNNVVLFHGAKREFSMPINFRINSKEKNDFGVGFYLGESFEQAANYISFLKEKKVYSFVFDLSGLKIYKFNVDTEWMIAIAYFRGWLDEHKNNDYIQNIIKKVTNSDVIIAPIADNRMFDIITEFIEGSITDEQCRHALAATNLGFQYVLKSDKCLENIKLVKEMFVCDKEKEKYIKSRVSLTSDGIQKVKIARIEYRGKGKYLEELLK